MSLVSGKDRVNLADIGPLVQEYLSREQVRTYEDLAKIHPYDSKLRFLGERLVGWVNQARTIVAEETIREVTVDDSIRVRCSKQYDADLTLKSVLTRLGMYELYLETSRREAPEVYEYEFALKPEQERYALGPWLEYKENARLYEALLAKSREKLVQPEIRPIEYPELLATFGADLVDVGHVKLVKEILLHVLFADRLHCLVVGKPSSPAKSTFATLLEKFTQGHLRHVCGSEEGAELLEERFASRRPQVLILQGLELATADEVRIITEIMTERFISANSGGTSASACVYAYSYLEGAAGNSGKQRPGKSPLSIPASVLKLFHYTVVSDAYLPEEFDRISKSIGSIHPLPDAKASLLSSYIQYARKLAPKRKAAPEKVISLMRALYKQRRRIIVPVTPELQRGMIETAKAHARIRLSETVENIDYERAAALTESAMRTCGFRPAAGSR